MSRPVIGGGETVSRNGRVSRFISTAEEAWAAWLWGAFAVQDLQLEVRAWAGVSLRPIVTGDW